MNIIEKVQNTFKYSLNNLLFPYIIKWYNKRLPQTIASISTHRPIKVMFYVNNIAMWKNDKLLDLLKKDERFEPMVVSYIYDFDTTENKIRTEKEISQYFDSKRVTYECGFDFKKNKLINIDTFKVDIVFYAQPYQRIFSQLPKKAIMAYIPYCFEMEDNKAFHNWLYQNICWKMFLPSDMHKKIEEKYNVSKGQNVVVTGYPLQDYFYDKHVPSDAFWKIKDRKIKRIIWAPHHSILPTDTLDYSNFLTIANDMLVLAKKYSDTVQFVFKPHPLLRDKLNKLPGWGKFIVDEYYGEWESLPNCSMTNGEYVDLFLTSDAMIHDSSSFIAEYLYVNKPVLFVSKNKCIPHINEFAKRCLSVHYQGSSINDIELFISNVIKEVDPYLIKRKTFVEKNLAKADYTVAEKIYKELTTIFE